MEYVKGHGTENDFVLLPDLGDELELTPTLVRALCDRQAGIGGDGVLRVAPAPAGSGAAWFMDYRNADGSVAEMCGNGIRVFARYLVAAGLAAPGTVPIASRAGTKHVQVGVEGDVTVRLGPYERPDVGPVHVRIGERSWPATLVRMPNPHAVTFVDDLAEAGDLRRPPLVEPASAVPDGANVELVVRHRSDHVAMRVHERGVGETRSCGTGAAAVAVATLTAGNESPAWPAAVRVDVPGGSLLVTVHADRQVDLTGPAVLVATGTVDPTWLAEITQRAETAAIDGRPQSESVRGPVEFSEAAPLASSVSGSARASAPVSPAYPSS